MYIAKAHWPIEKVKKDAIFVDNTFKTCKILLQDKEITLYNTI